MRKGILIMLAFLPVNELLAGRQKGVVVSVDKMAFTIKPELGDKVTMRFGPDMGKRPNKWVASGTPLGATAEQLKVGMIVRAEFHKEGDSFVCTRAIIFVENLGTREIDFGSMQIKGKDSLPQFRLRLQLYSRESLGNFRPYVREFSFKEGTSVKDMRQEVKRILIADDWKVKEVGDTKLVVESFKTTKKDEPLNQVIIAAEGLPKDQQPSVRRINPQDPSK